MCTISFDLTLNAQFAHHFPSQVQHGRRLQGVPAVDEGRRSGNQPDGRRHLHHLRLGLVRMIIMIIIIIASNSIDDDRLVGLPRERVGLIA